MTAQDAISYYRTVKDHLSREYSMDIEYFRKLATAGLENLNSRFLLVECSWVGYAAGFRAATLDKKWEGIKRSFKDFDVDSILANPQSCMTNVLATFAHKAKAEYVVNNARKIKEIQARFGSVGNYLKKLQSEGPNALEYSLQGSNGGFKGIGKDTVRQLIRNLGLASLEKPDRHLLDLAARFECSVPELVGTIATTTEDPRGVVDYILWLSTLNPRPSPGLTLRKHQSLS